MKTLEGLKVKALAIEVPDDAHNFTCLKNQIKPCLLEYEYGEIDDVFDVVIPEGNWQILGRAMDLGDEQIKLLLSGTEYESNEFTLESTWEHLMIPILGLTNELILIKI